MYATPPICSPLYSSPMSVAQMGTWRMNDLVPSIGSMTQRKPLVPGWSPNSSPRNPSCGNAADTASRMSFSALLSATVTGLLSALCSTSNVVS